MKHPNLRALRGAGGMNSAGSWPGAGGAYAVVGGWIGSVLIHLIGGGPVFLGRILAGDAVLAQGIGVGAIDSRLQCSLLAEGGNQGLVARDYRFSNSSIVSVYYCIAGCHVIPLSPILRSGRARRQRSE